MLQFLGSTEAKLDVKGRIFVPASFRKILYAADQTNLVLRKDIFQNCLTLYPLIVWEGEVAKLRSRLTRWGKVQQQVFRQFVMDAERLEIDTSGRILIPKRYLDMVGFEFDAQILGVDNTIEIWPKGELEATLVSSDEFGLEIQRLMSGEVNE